ncbi:MAG: sugar phosphate isomerase/epimerase [Deltaproteobacteria bacterium]|nr:MAG: sugar phosphate isomerase/epimerase [Deltaproteobacteria bacterium]
MERLWSRENLGIATFPLMEEGLEGFLVFAASLGLNYVEIRSERPYAFPQDIGKKETERIGEKLTSFSLEPIIHTAVYDINLASLNPLIRKASIRQTVESIKFAAKIGAKIVIIHPGRLPKDYPPMYMKNSRINLLTSLNVMARMAGRMGVMLAIENSPRGTAHRLVATPQEHLYILKRLGSPHLGALLDLGHAYTWGLDLRQYIRFMAEYILLFHLHDNRGGADEHLPLGKGNVDLKGIMGEIQRLTKHHPLILNMRRREDIEESIKFLEKMGKGRGLGRLLGKKGVPITEVGGS